MKQYLYTQVTGGYRWNMIQRIINEVGIEPKSTCDVGTQTVIEFDQELSSSDKNKLDQVMADNPTSPPSSLGTKYLIKDIWEKRSDFKTNTGGLNFKLYFTESVVGSKIFDQIELHFDKILSVVEETTVKTEYAKLISKKV